MKKFLSVAVVFMALGLSAAPVFSDDTHHVQSGAQKTYAAQGEVMAVDAAAGKLKLKHGTVPELKWPGMTMDFPVADKALLNGVKAGDKVDFRFELVNGSARVVEIKRVK